MFSNRPLELYFSPSHEMASDRTPNGAFRAKRVPRREARLQKPSRNIAAIDFGTKNCSLAYITENDRLELTQGVPKLPLNGTYLRVPTAILLNHEGQVEAFGHDARTLYGNLEDYERECYFYFEEIKMNLRRDQEVSRKMKVKASNGKEFFLVDVIAQILKYLKKEFLVNHLQRGGHPFQATDFDWVITVPAIWKAKGKQLMREAGYKGEAHDCGLGSQAGLCSHKSCGDLKVASASAPLDPSEGSPDKLSLALEPESAALYCHEMLKRKLVAPYCDMPQEQLIPHRYLIVDIGGGTVDISAHQVVNYVGSQKYPVVEELYPPVGNDCGGMKVNQGFVAFLERLVSDVGFSNFIETCDPEIDARNNFELNQVINVAFEEQKQIFGRIEKHKRRDSVIRLPATMLEMYQEELQDGVETLGTSNVRLVRQSLRISPSKMEELMQTAMAGIFKCVSDLLSTLSTSIDVIYLVGGFGGSPYVYWQFVKKYRDQYQIIVPPNPEFAVVEGAVLFRINPSIIRARKADATYGKSVIRPFNGRIHDHKNRVVDDDNIPQCYNLFQTIVEVGETINPDYVYMCTSIPVRHSQRNMIIEIYSSHKNADEVWYVSGEKSGGSLKIGEVIVDMPVQRGDKLREVEFTFDFSHTEILVKGYDKTSGREVKTLIDFLSAQSE